MSQTKQEQREQLRDSIVLLLVRSPGLTVAQIIDEIVAAGVVPRTSSTERRTRAMLNNMLASGIITKTGHPHRYTATPANAKDLPAADAAAIKPPASRSTSRRSSSTAAH